MNALVANDYGPPEQLAVARVPRPAPGPGQVMLEVKAASVNPADVLLVTGKYHERRPLRFPFVPGRDLAGTVAALGEGVTRFAVGDAVFGSLETDGGAFAEYAVTGAQSAQLARRPEELDPARAAALSTVGLTALGMLGAAGLQPGETVLVIGGSGGVGSVLVQLLSRRGAHVVATARPEHYGLVRELGAAEIIDRERQDVVEEVLRRHPRGVAALFDAAGLGAGATAMARAVRDEGAVVSVLRLPDAAAFGRGLTAIADVWPGRAEPGQLSELGSMVAGGSLRVEVSGTYRLHGAPGAIAAMRDAHKPGKLVVMVP